MKYATNIFAFMIGLIIGAILLYGFLWYQVFQKIEPTWCQVYTGKLSVEQSAMCDRYK